VALRLLIPLALLLAAGGFAGGLWGWRYLDRLDGPSRPQRPAVLEDAWNAWYTRDPGKLNTAVDALPASFGEETWDREAQLVRLLAARKWDALRTFADQHAQDHSGAQALRVLIDRAADASERAALETLFAQRFPESSFVPKEP